jgi:hypothetical protein
MTYVPTSEGEHGRDEELQWARVVAHSDPARGVALIFIQKLCTAFHEFEPAWRAGALNIVALEHCQRRLAGRARRVLQLLEANNLGAIDGVDQLRLMVASIEAAGSLELLAALAEPVHDLNHRLTDALERG